MRLLLFPLYLIQNLCGHTSPVESVAFDPGEEFVVAGASAGAIKLWDLEQAKSKLFTSDQLCKQYISFG